MLTRILTAVALTLTLASESEARMPVFQPPPAPPGAARPIKRTLIDIHGVRWWRALYQLEDGDRVVVEWGCDPVDQDPGAICGSQLAAALPGFGDAGNVTSPYVKLVLELEHESVLDGARVWTAAPGRSHVIDTPPQHRWGVPETGAG